MDAVLSFFEKWMDGKNRPYISVVNYVVSGTLLVITAFSLISPFKCSMEFLDNTDWTRDLSNDDPIIQAAFGLSVLYIIIYVIKQMLLWALSGTSVSVYNSTYAVLETLCDIVDLCSSFAYLALCLSSFLQMYNTSTFFFSHKAVFLYLWVGAKSIDFVWRRFYIRNATIINSVSK